MGSACQVSFKCGRLLLFYSIPTGLCYVREVISTLGFVYPAMFRQSKPGIGIATLLGIIKIQVVLSVNELGVLSGFAPAVKVPGLNQLAQRMIDRVRNLTILSLLKFTTYILVQV